MLFDAGSVMIKILKAMKEEVESVLPSDRPAYWVGIVVVVLVWLASLVKWKIVA